MTAVILVLVKKGQSSAGDYLPGLAIDTRVLALSILNLAVMITTDSLVSIGNAHFFCLFIYISLKFLRLYVSISSTTTY